MLSIKGQAFTFSHDSLLSSSSYSGIKVSCLFFCTIRHLERCQSIYTQAIFNWWSVLCCSFTPAELVRAKNEAFWMHLPYPKGKLLPCHSKEEAQQLCTGTRDSLWVSILCARVHLNHRCRLKVAVVWIWDLQSFLIREVTPRDHGLSWKFWSSKK